MPFTGILGTENSALGNIVLGIALSSQDFEESAENTLALVSTAVAESDFLRAPTSTIALVDQADENVDFALSASSTLALASVVGFQIGQSTSNTLALSQIVAVARAASASNTLNLQQALMTNQILASASNILALVQDVVPSFVYASGNNALVLTQLAYAGQNVLASASNTLALVDLAEATNLSQYPENTLVLTQEALGDTTIIDRLTSNTLELVDLAEVGAREYHANLPFETIPSPYLQLVQTVVVAGPILISASNALALTQDDPFDQDIINKSVTSLISFSQSAGRQLTESVESELELVDEGLRIVTGESQLFLTQDATAVRSYNLSSTLALTQSATRLVVFTRSLGTILGLKQGVAVYVESSCITKEYAPFIGLGDGSITPPPVTAPTLSTSDVVLTWPYVAPSSTITLKRPEFGNGDRLDFARILRETRGGTLKVYADPDWPRMQIMTLDFGNMSQDQRDDLLEFLYDSIGQEIGFLDWENRQWRGIINNPDTEITQIGRCQFTVQLEFEGVLA